jgi:hypothetical protein
MIRVRGFVARLAALLLGACDPPLHDRPPPRADADPVTGCTLSVRFGSYAMGIDQPTYARVRAFLAERRVRLREDRWGREGEVTLCADLAPRRADKLARAVARLLPAAPRGPIAVESAGGFRLDRGTASP